MAGQHRFFQKRLFGCTAPGRRVRLLARRRGHALPCATCPADRPAPWKYRRHSLGASRHRRRMFCHSDPASNRPTRNLHTSKLPSPTHWTRSSTLGCSRENPMQPYPMSPACLATPRLCPSSSFQLVAVIGRTLPAHFRSRGTYRPAQRTLPDHSHRSVAANVERLSSCRRTAASALAQRSSHQVRNGVRFWRSITPRAWCFATP